MSHTYSATRAGGRCVLASQLPLEETALVLLAVTLGALVQGSIGFGFALIAAPTLTLLRPDALPATLLLIAVPMTALMAMRERAAIDVPGFLHALGGRVLGTLAGAGLLLVVPAGYLSVLIGAIILVAVATSAVSPEVEVRRATSVGAGFASGVMGTAAAVGGPPMALLYKDRPGAELRSTLAASFVVGSVLSLIALAASGKVEAWHALLALQLFPGMLLGLLLSRYTLRLVDRGWMRAAVLGFAATAGAVAVVKGLIE